MDRFEGSFHQSDLKAYLKCPRSFYYNRVLGLDKEKVSLANLAGRAGHSTLEHAHKTPTWDTGALFRVFLELLEMEKFKALDKDLDVHGSLDVEKYRKMFEGYVSKAWNREAEIIELETEFYFEIQPSRTTYIFEGRIDQLVRIETRLLREDFPYLFQNIDKSHGIIHRDTKTGQRRWTSAFELALDVQIDVYAHALRHGVFYDRETGQERFLDLVPDFHALYFLQDHIPYQDDTGTLLSQPGEEPVRLCNYTDVYNNDYVTADIDFMRATATWSEIERFGLQVGDVIITKDSETPDDIGIPTVIDSTAPDLVCSYHLALLRPNQDEVDPTFLAKQLAHHRIVRYFG